MTLSAELDDDTLSEILSDAVCDGEGRITPKNFRFHLEKHGVGLTLVPGATPKLEGIEELRALSRRARDLISDPTQGYATPLSMQTNYRAQIADEWISKLCDAIDTALNASERQLAEANSRIAELEHNEAEYECIFGPKTYNELADDLKALSDWREGDLNGVMLHIDAARARADTAERQRDEAYAEVLYHFQQFDQLQHNLAVRRSVLQGGDGVSETERRATAQKILDSDLKKVPRPQPLGFTINEGGNWYDWEGRKTLFLPTQEGLRFHSIKFSDGSIFDMFNGWR